MSSTKLIKTEDTHTREELADLLEALAARVRDGELLFEQGTEQIALALPETVGVDVQVKDKVKRERHRRALEVEVRWELDDQGTPVDTTVPAESAPADSAPVEG